MRVQAADRVVVHVGLVRLAAEEVELAQLVRGRVRVRVRVRVTVRVSYSYPYPYP